jgi:hypothetical protein
MIVILSLGTILHLAFASTGWFYRYEAYLLLPALLLVSLLVYRYGAVLLNINQFFASILVLILSFAIFFPFILRSMAAFAKAKQACVNIYEQQYQMARFIKSYYPDKVVAANDIGAISFFTDAKIVDLWGLGNIDIARSRKNKSWTPVFLDSLVQSQKVSIAVIYDQWFDPAMYKSWSKSGTWTITNNVITGGETVSFYCIQGDSCIKDQQQLRDFESELPESVISEYPVTERHNLPYE